MSEPVFAPCPAEWTNECGCAEAHNYCWPEPLVNCCPELQITDTTPQATVDIINQSKRVAVEILHAFSGRQFGLCRRVVRPCLDDCHQNGSVATAWVDGQLRPTLEGGVWYNRDVCGKCQTTGCGCADICEVTLPGLVQSITNVWLNGELVPASQYRVDNHRKLVRTKQFVPLPGPTSLSTVAGPPTTFNVWCDPSPGPDAIPGFDAPVDGCYTPNVSNPTFYWANQGVVEATYAPTQDETVIISFFNGLYPGDITGSYNFDAYNGTGSHGPGSVLTSTQTGGAFMRITVLSGSIERYETTPYGWTVSPNTRLRMERLGESSGGCWPKCQDLLGDPLADDNTFQVEYRRGVPVPHAGRWAAGLLACELVKACLPGTGECRLPDNVRSVAREGVTMELAPFIIGGADGEIQFGRTGVPEVDMWLISVNPHKVRSRSRAYSPDRPNPRRRTWPCP